jgi:hypothetical protein
MLFLFIGFGPSPEVPKREIENAATAVDSLLLSDLWRPLLLLH